MLADLKIDGDSAYFTDLADTTHISRVSLCGGSVTLLGTTSDLAAGGGAAARSGVILSLTQSSVVFCNGSSLGELPKAGGAESVLATNRSGWIGSGLAESSGYLYWMQYPLSSTTSSAEIDRLAVSDGGPAQSVATGLGIGPTTVAAADAANYYWSAAAGNVQSVPVTGGAITILESDSRARTVSGITVDSHYVYFALSGSCTSPVGGAQCPPPQPTDSAIIRVPIGSGATTVLATDTDIAGIAVDAQYVYWVAPYDSVKFAPLSGGWGARVLASNELAYLGPVVQSGSVYWVSMAGATTSVIKRSDAPQ
jgi:hypothetical protein